MKPKQSRRAEEALDLAKEINRLRIEIASEKKSLMLASQMIEEIFKKYETPSKETNDDTA